MYIASPVLPSSIPFLLLVSYPLHIHSQPFLFHTHTHSISQTHTHTHTPYLKHTHTHSISQTHTHIPFLKHTHTFNQISAFSFFMLASPHLHLICMSEFKQTFPPFFIYKISKKKNSNQIKK
ncbi:hypothetical protein DM01DRAFT_150234 [Hesseltinella vesiculosa]|uniref:Uncharacterized protein n=1 Tax=Hesseltinella vesiculosa TaxID=101127 RepID=A0A1X2GKE1_9FUNG|nr:hypothetical protein DM01DRAFT_150234 [Hesseltinella vesiculosa]